MRATTREPGRKEAGRKTRRNTGQSSRGRHGRKPGSAGNGRRSGRGEPAPSGQGKQSTESRRRWRRLEDLESNRELVASVLLLHTHGLQPKQIIAEIKKKPEFQDLKMKREDPNWIVQQEALAGRLFHQPLVDSDCEKQITRGPWPTPRSLRVVTSFDVQSIAEAAAGMLVDMLRSIDKETVHIGVAGGHTMRALMAALARELKRPLNHVPNLHFHALAAGFDPEDPTTNPNVFVTFFDEQLVVTSIKFTGLSAPAIVSPETFGQLEVYDDIREAFAAMDQIDIFVTSGTSWHGHSVLWGRMEKSDREMLEAARVVGDVLWRPISLKGPIEVETARRAFTLVELSKLQDLIRRNRTQVLLALAPCGLCRATKGEVLRGVLESRLATHVVVDMRSAMQLLGAAREAGHGAH